jgi:hypothetical protein
MLYDVFLYTAASDRELAVGLRTVLQNRRLTIWLADDGMPTLTLAENLKTSRVALLLLSPAAMASDLVNVVTRLVAENEKRFVLVRIGRPVPPTFLLPPADLSYECNFSLTIESHLERLADLIAGLPDLVQSRDDRTAGILLQTLANYEVEVIGPPPMASPPEDEVDYDFARGGPRTRRLDESKGPPRFDRVNCTAFASAQACRGEDVLVQVLAHRPRHTAQATHLARLADHATQKRARKSLQSQIRFGDTLAFDLDVAPFVVDSPRQSLIWNGSTQVAQFRLHVPQTCHRRKVIATVTISVGTVPVGDIKFRLDVTDPVTAPVAPEPIGDAALRYEFVFVSYAWSDRAEVGRRVQMLDILGIRYFQDLLDLKPGERWEQQLYRRIDEADLFLLFWSNAARQSKWVRLETQYAIRRKGGNELAPPAIKPVVIDGPPPPKPWPELRALHFNDKFIYLARAMAA